MSLKLKQWATLPFFVVCGAAVGFAIGAGVSVFGVLAARGPGVAGTGASDIVGLSLITGGIGTTIGVLAGAIAGAIVKGSILRLRSKHQVVWIAGGATLILTAVAWTLLNLLAWRDPIWIPLSIVTSIVAAAIAAVVVDCAVIAQSNSLRPSQHSL